MDVRGILLRTTAVPFEQWHHNELDWLLERWEYFEADRPAIEEGFGALLEDADVRLRAAALLAFAEKSRMVDGTSALVRLAARADTLAGVPVDWFPNWRDQLDVLLVGLAHRAAVAPSARDAVRELYLRHPERARPGLLVTDFAWFALNLPTLLASEGVRNGLVERLVMQRQVGIDTVVEARAWAIHAAGAEPGPVGEFLAVLEERAGAEVFSTALDVIVAARASTPGFLDALGGRLGQERVRAAHARLVGGG